MNNFGGGVQLHFKESGQGRAVILLHGLFGSSDNWHFLAQRLAEKFHVFALDQRNHGQSPHSDEMNYSLMAADVEDFFRARDLQNAFVIGHSMGGKTAMQFALQFPQRVEKLVVADMAPRAYAAEYGKFFVTLLALELPKYKTRAQIEDALAEKIPDLGLRRFLLKNLGRDAVGEFFWKMNLRGLAENYSQLRAPIPSARPFLKPALFLRGEKSNYINAQDEPLIYELFPLAKIETLAGAGHWLHAEQPEEFLRRVLDFL